MFLGSKESKEPSVSSTFVMLNSISDNAKGDWCRQSLARAKGVDKYMGKGVFKVNRRGN